MDNDTDHVVIQIKKGRVTNKVELLPEAEFVIETRTVSKDGNTVTTTFPGRPEYGEVQSEIEERVNGKTVKKTEKRGDGSIFSIIEFDKNGSISTTYLYGVKGNLESLNSNTEYKNMM